MELLLAMTLFSVMVLGISTVQIFCQQTLVNTNRKARVTNQVSYVLEHMSKYIGMGVGNAGDYPVTINAAPSFCTNAIQVWTDLDQSGTKNAPDCKVLYCLNSTTHTLSFYSNYTSESVPGPVEFLGYNILQMIVYVIRNAVDVTIVGCLDASASSSLDNPRITLQTRIVMPLVSSNATP